MTSVLANFATLLALIGTVMHADPARDARKRIQAIYDARNSAYAAHDLDRALLAYAPEFTLSTTTGQRLRLTQLRRSLGSVVPRVRKAKIQSRIRRFQFFGDGALVTLQRHIDLRVLVPMTGRTYHLLGDATTEDAWSRTTYGWLERRSRELSRKETIQE